MPKLKLNSAAVAEIESAGVKQQWLENLIAQWNKPVNCTGAHLTKDELEKINTGKDLLYNSFIWGKTPEGNKFWSLVWNKLVDTNF